MFQGKETVIYVTREIERALGLPLSDHYLIVTNRTPFGERVREQHPDSVILTDSPGGESLGTGDLLKHPKTEELVMDLTNRTGARPYIMVFKNTARIEPLARERGWTLLNPSAETSERIENKISQVTWLGELEHFLPPHRLQTTKSVAWKGTPFVIQWAHGHTGTGTTLIESEERLKEIQAKFPERRTRVTEFIKGPSFTLNGVVTPDKISIGNISYQITGLKPFTDSAFATVGNDWGVVKKILSEEDIRTMRDMAKEIGEKMQKDFWRGLFGIDVIKDAARGRLYLIEVNARQPASAPYESYLQEVRRAEGAPGLTSSEAHMAALLGHPIDKPIVEIDDGAQIVQRVTEGVRSMPEDAAGTLELSGYRVISYPNSDKDEDLLRIQSRKSIMAGDNELNEEGRGIAEVLKQ